MMKSTQQIPQFGASLSIKQCRNFEIYDQKVLAYALRNLGLKRFRLMSYWDEIEQTPGSYDFSYLDTQIKTIVKNGGTISLCIGVRQPRWPESHWPEWSKKLKKSEQNNVLFRFIETTIRRYRKNPSILSWQLENEALLKNFGLNGDFDRKRIVREYKLVKQLDPFRPIVMTTSTSWGVPLRGPIPDIVGFSYYRITHSNGVYRKSIYQPWVFRIRAMFIRIIWRRPSFIHELQAEPWGHKNIWDMTDAEQSESMNKDLLKLNVQMAKKTGLYPIDLWGLEWWYWLHINKKAKIPKTIQAILSDRT